MTPCGLLYNYTLLISVVVMIYQPWRFDIHRGQRHDVNRYQKSITVLMNAFKIIIRHHCTLQSLLMLKIQPCGKN